MWFTADSKLSQNTHYTLRLCGDKAQILRMWWGPPTRRHKKEQWNYATHAEGSIRVIQKQWASL